MTTGKEAFESACQIGVSRSYNYRQLSQIFFGIDAAIAEVSGEASQNGSLNQIIISGDSFPASGEAGQTLYAQTASGDWVEYAYLDNDWRAIVTSTDNIIASGTSPRQLLPGVYNVSLRHQADVNRYLYELITDSGQVDIDLDGYAQLIVSGEAPSSGIGPNHLWYDTDRLELFIYYIDPSGVGGWVPTSPLGARVEAGEIVQAQILERIESGEVIQSQIDARIDDALITQAEIAESVVSGETVQGLLITQVSGIETRVASGETIQENLVPRVLAAETTQTELVNRVASGETTQQQIVGRLDLLETTRGADKIYQVHSVTTELAVRNGELVFNNADATLVSFISLAPFDSVGNPSPLVNVDDIIDVEVGGVINRYQVAQGTTDAQSILCIYLSGDSTYAVDQTATIYIYPQNSSNLATTEYVDEQNEAQDARTIKLDVADNITTAAFRLKASNGNVLLSTATGDELNIYNLADPSGDKHAISRGYADGRYLPTTALDPYETKEYIDQQDALKLNLTGGDLTGSLNTDSLIKSIRTSGYAFQVHDEANDNNVAFIHSNGNIRGAQGVFTDTLEVRNTALFKKTTTFEQNISVTNSVNCNGGWISGNWGFERNTKGLRWYSDDRSDHLADITWQTAKLETLMYSDYLWTLKVQNQDNTDSNVLIYADYSSGLILNEVNELNATGNITLEGNLNLTGTGKINANQGSSALSGRVSLEIASAADFPIGISSGSSYKKLLAFYGYDGSKDDNRGEVASINANGNAYFNEVYSNDEKLATESFVNAGGGMRWRHADHEVAGDLVPGEFFVAGNGNIYLHPTSYDGVDLAPSSTATEVTGVKQLGSVHRPNGDSAYFITWTGINFNNGSNKYIRVNKDATHLGDSTSPGIIYRLNIPGFTF